jgi:hypothetical protein
VRACIYSNLGVGVGWGVRGWCCRRRCLGSDRTCYELHCHACCYYELRATMPPIRPPRDATNTRGDQAQVQALLMSLRLRR